MIIPTASFPSILLEQMEETKFTTENIDEWSSFSGSTNSNKEPRKITYSLTRVFIFYYFFYVCLYYRRVFVSVRKFSWVYLPHALTNLEYFLANFAFILLETNLSY